MIIIINVLDVCKTSNVPSRMAERIANEGTSRHFEYLMWTLTDVDFIFVNYYLHNFCVLVCFSLNSKSDMILDDSVYCEVDKP